MLKASLTIALAIIAVSVQAKPQTPAELHIVSKCKSEDVDAKPKDLVEIRISNPVLPVRVHDLDVEVRGGAILVAIVNTTNGLPGGDRISIFVRLNSSDRSGSVEYSYKDGEEKEHKCRVLIQIHNK